MAANWTKEERAEYNRKRKEGLSLSSDVDRYTIRDIKIEPNENNFKGLGEDEPIVCSRFGCRKHLNLDEQRMGKICFSCFQLENKIEPSDYVVHFKKAI